VGFSPVIVSNNSGVACDCASCGTPQWYDRGVCQGCGSASDVAHTWIAQCAPGGAPTPLWPFSGFPYERTNHCPSELAAVLPKSGHHLIISRCFPVSSAHRRNPVVGACQNGQSRVQRMRPKLFYNLRAAAGDQLINVWADLVLLRGLSPYLVPPSHNLVQYSSPAWYVERGIEATVSTLVPADPGFSERLNRASSWANQSLLVRLVATFEAFLDSGKHLKDVSFQTRRDARVPSCAPPTECRCARRRPH